MTLAFLSAAGFASSSILYNLGDPPFLHDIYAVAPFQVTLLIINLKSSPHCCYLRYRWTLPAMAQFLRIRLLLEQTLTAISRQLYPLPFTTGLDGKTIPLF